MSNLREQRIDEVAAQYPLIPKNLFAPAVDAAGLVDSDYLAGIVSAFQAGVSGKVAAQNAETAAQLRELKTAYAAAQARRDASAMVSLTGRIFALERGAV